MAYTRRTFLATTACGVLAGGKISAFEPNLPDLKQEVGVTTGSFVKHLSDTPKPGKLYMLYLPKIMRDELGMKVIDLMTATVPSMKTDYLDQFRSKAEQAGCIITNFKMNLKGLDLAHEDAEVRRQGLTEFKRMIDVAQRLGCRWVRPQPEAKRPNVQRLAESYRELIDYAAPKGLSLLVENNSWMRTDPTAIPQITATVGRGIAASPDTGNWADEVRYTGLAKAFPLAVTCDFKALAFDADGRHPYYDLQRCFQVGWDSGFRGPWCLEHFHDNLPGLLAGMVKLRDMLKGWMAETQPLQTQKP